MIELVHQLCYLDNQNLTMLNYGKVIDRGGLLFILVDPCRPTRMGQCGVMWVCVDNVDCYKTCKHCLVDRLEWQFHQKNYVRNMPLRNL